MLNIMVTGGNGFLGKEILSSYLKDKYRLFNINRSLLNITDFNKVKSFILQKNIDVIIHCAVKGGRRNRIDTAQDYYDNILMFENLINSLSNISLFINFDSGAAFDRRQNIHRFKEEQLGNSVPDDFYGSSKYTISKRILNLEKSINLRIFGCFSANEDDTRLIKSNIKKYISNEDLVLHQNREMDFIYSKDVISVVDFYINNRIILNKLPKDINLCYEEKVSLLHILNIINNLSDKKSNIVTNNNNDGLSYSGDGKKLSSLNIKLLGLEYGINEVYNTLRKQNDQ
jgi:nucleoside-diphosphate-sugar epimerase